MKKKYKVLIALSVVFVVLTTFFCVVLHDVTIAEGDGELNGKYQTVLADIDGIVEANPRFVDIAMLGSHDAVTDTISRSTPIDYNDKDKAQGKLDPIMGGISYRFAKTQTVGLDKQLAQGARFFHIKCTDYDGEWYGSHTHLCGKMSDHITDILQYLASDEAKGEIVVLLFQITYFGDGENLDTFNDFVQNTRYEGKSLFDYVYIDDADTYDTGNGGVRIGDLRYNDLTQNGTAPGVVIFNRREEGKFKSEWDGVGELTQKCFDMDACAVHDWHNSIGEDRLIDKINTSCDKIEEDTSLMSKFRLNQTQAAFAVHGIGEFFSAIGAWSLIRFAASYNISLIENKNFDKWLSYMPVFQVDFCNSDKGDFNNKVNEKIKNHNTTLVKNLLNGSLELV